MPNGFRLLMLLSTPFPLRPSAAVRFVGHYRQPLAALSSSAASYGRLFSEVSSSKISFLVRPAEKVHTQAVVKEGHSDIVSPSSALKDSHPWPEWSKLIDHLLANGNSQRRVCPDDEEESFLIDAELPEAFLKAAEACLVYAKERPDILRLLTKKNVEKLVENENPSMFRSGEISARRMKLFLSGQESEIEKAQTIDVMRYLLSYMYKQFYASNGNQFMVDESVETAVRKLFVELYNLSGTVWIDKLAKPSSTEPPSVQEHISRPSGQGFEMKRGDWICPKCTFVNFARNMSCLECGEMRTKRQLTGAEWECPQCDFFNYGRNMSCLRCDCKRPEDVLLGSAPSSGLGHSTSSTIEQISSPHGQDSIGGSSKKIGSDDRSDSISRSLDRILSRSSPSGTQPSSGDNTLKQSNLSSSDYRRGRKFDSVPFVPLPPDMFKKTPEPNSAAQRLSNEGVTPSSRVSELIDSLSKSSESYTASNSSKEPSDTSTIWSKVTAELDNAKDVANDMSNEDFPDVMPMRKGENRFVVSKKKDRSFSSPAYKRRLASEQANNFNSSPFVPFPPGYFAKKDNQPATASAENSATPEAKAENGEEQKVEMSNWAESSPAHSEGRIYGKNLNQSNVNMDYGPSSGYSFQQNTRSWENKTQMSNAFDAKKFDENLSDSSYSSVYSTDPASNLGKYGGLAFNSNTSDGFTANYSQPSWDKRDVYSSPQGGYSAGSAQQSDNWWNKKDAYNGEFGPGSAGPHAASRNIGTSQSSINSWNSDNLNSGGRGPGLANNASWGSAQQAKNWQNGQNNQNGGYSVKSLEGSLVKEPDPLDMSEEAKAERWFRRAAQIKDISELSQIPDEDFPEIMPMRKGVNRFVVSKRKTPLERRLTSPQYRRNLPTVSSELDKDANN